VIEKLTNPVTIKKNLVLVALFVTASEMLKSPVEDKIRDFLREIIGFDNGKGVVTEVTHAYREVILDGDIPEKINKKTDFQVFYASCLWFQELEVITETDVIDLQAIC